MKFIFFLIPLILLTACTARGNLPESGKIATLEHQIDILSGEIATLKEDMNLLKLGGTPGIATPTGNGTYPEGTSFEEGSYDGCMRKASDAFIQAGNQKCTNSGFSESDIAGGKCQISKSIITELNTEKTKAEGLCKNLYNY